MRGKLVKVPEVFPDGSSVLCATVVSYVALFCHYLLLISLSFGASGGL